MTLARNLLPRTLIELLGAERVHAAPEAQATMVGRSFVSEARQARRQRREHGVRQEILRIIDCWLAYGISGFRNDAAPVLIGIDASKPVKPRGGY